VPTWLAALLPLVGVIVGATIQHFLSRSQEAVRQRQSLRASAYVDYLRAVCSRTIAQREGRKEDESKGIALMTDAKARMCIYGDANTLHALADFHRIGCDLATRDGIDAFLALCEAMRAEVDPVPGAREDVSRILFEGTARLPPKS
jgi:hypothetical protein